MRCDCGETDKPHHSREKCVHLREAEERAKAGYPEDHHAGNEPFHLAAVAEEQDCCCHHGGDCSCATLKKETGEDVAAPHGPAVKPRLEKTISEGSITVFTNGHHKPVHRKNHAAHEAGMPYKLPMPRAHIDNHVATAARRSVDNLALDYKVPFDFTAFDVQDMKPYSTERRKSKSEQHSPKIPAIGATCSGGLHDEKLMSIDFSNLSQTQTNSSMQSATSSSYFSNMDPMSGVNDNSFDPWSAFPSSDSAGVPNNNPFGVWPTNNDGSSVVQPPLTAASSGTQSEIDEIPPMEDLYGFSMPSIQEDTDNAEMMNMATSSSPQSNRRSLPPGFFGNIDFTMGGLSNDWLSSVGNFDDSADTKMQSTPPPGFDDIWQVQSVPQRALGGMIQGNRPQSRSVGSAPSDDLIKQLFPEMDLNGDDFDPTNSPQMNMAKGMGQPPTSHPTSAPMDFGQMDTNVGFTSQSWSDGSISMPSDTFTTPYNLDEDYANSDYSAGWTQ